MNASLVYDGNGLPDVFPTVPTSMGDPLPDQLQGTPFERLSEMCSRICYDSLGVDENGKRRGRSSAKLYEHILEVKNHSVLEHANFTVVFDFMPMGRDMSFGMVYAMLAVLLNRKGVHVELGARRVSVTVNLRAVLEWDRYSRSYLGTVLGKMARVFGHRFRRHASALAPMIVPEPPPLASEDDLLFDTGLKTDRLTDDQAWISLWLYGSRGLTHEQVRHRFSMSQRSTRYVDEDGSPYCTHPLVTKFLADERIDRFERDFVRANIDHSASSDRETYAYLVEALEAYNIFCGLDKQTARKQARGAARSYLGNGLASEMIYSAPVSGWRWIISQRLNRLADAEIRCLYVDVLTCLKGSRYGDRFADMETEPSPDGMGQVLKVIQS